MEEDKEQLKESLKRVEKTKYIDYLQGFDEEFSTHTKEKINEIPLIKNLFDVFIQEMFRPSRVYKIVNEAKAKLKDELENCLDSEQKGLLEKWTECEDLIIDDKTEQAFVYGYIMCSELKEETKKQYTNFKNQFKTD